MPILYSTDIDECLDKCLFNATCTNTPGSYFCTCHLGFAPSNGQLNSIDPKVDCIGEWRVCWTSLERSISLLLCVV